MYVIKGISLGLLIFLIGFVVYIFRTSSKFPMGSTLDIRGFISPTVWLALLGIVLLCTAFFRSRR